MKRNWKKETRLTAILAASLLGQVLAAQDPATSGLLFQPIADCILFDSMESGTRVGSEVLLLAGQREGEPLCSSRAWSEGVRAALLRIEAKEPATAGILKVWAGLEDLEPKAGVLATAPAQLAQGLVLVDLCPGAEAAAGVCADKLWARLEGGDAELRVELVGLFERPEAVERTLDEKPEEAQTVAANSVLVAPYWLENANGIHFNGGKVGVSSSLPESLFQVGSWETAATRYLLGGDSISMQGIEEKDHLPYLEMRDETNLRAFYLGWGSKTGRWIDWKFENNYKLSIQGGKVGIGTTTPDASLDVVGNLSVRNIPPDDATPANASINLYSREAGGSKHRWALHTASVGGGFGVVPNSLTIWEYDGRSCTSPSPVCHPRMVFEPNTGNVGIGTQDPQARLHVVGDLKLDGRLVSNGDICIGSCP